MDDSRTDLDAAGEIAEPVARERRTPCNDRVELIAQTAYEAWIKRAFISGVHTKWTDLPESSRDHWRAVGEAIVALDDEVRF